MKKCLVAATKWLFVSITNNCTGNIVQISFFCRIQLQISWRSVYTSATGFLLHRANKTTTRGILGSLRIVRIDYSR